MRAGGKGAQSGKSLEKAGWFRKAGKIPGEQEPRKSRILTPNANILGPRKVQRCLLLPEGTAATSNGSEINLFTQRGVACGGDVGGNAN